MVKYCVILDANFFLVPVQFNIDIYSELDRQIPAPFDIILPDVVIGELEAKIKHEAANHGKIKGTLSRQLNLARQIANQYNIQIIHVQRLSGQPVDTLLLLLAAEMEQKGSRVILATNDANLRRKARAAGYATAWLRAKKVIEVSIR